MMGIWLQGQRLEVVGPDDLFAVLLFVERLGIPVKWEKFELTEEKL